MWSIWSAWSACTPQKPLQTAEDTETSDATTSDATTSDATLDTATTEPPTTSPPTTTPETGDTGTAGTTTIPPERDYSSDRALFFGESRCDVANVWVCDGFEDGTIDPTRWSAHAWAPGPTLDPAKGARGAGSLHFHTESNGFTALLAASLFPAPDDAYWGRMFVWFDTMPVAPSWAHWTIVGAAGPDVAGEIRVGGQYDPYFGADRWGVGSDGGATGDWMFLDDDDGPVATPTGEWVCVEWQHDATNDETRFYWDATEHPSLATTASTHGGSSDPYQLPSFDSLWIGWWLYQSYPSPDHYDLWIDEVAFDGERIGCVL